MSFRQLDQAVSLLVVAAHADDEVIGCGGTMARFADEGERVTVAIVTVPHVQEHYSECLALATRRRSLHAQRAAEILGVSRLACHQFPEASLSLAEHGQLIARWLRDLVKEEGPEHIIGPGWADLHQDHRIVGEVLSIVARPWAHGVDGASRLWAYSTDFIAHPGVVPHRLNAYVDITRTLERKMRALACYADEMQPFPHPRSLEQIEATAKVMGSRAGVHAAEAFETIWEVI